MLMMGGAGLVDGDVGMGCSIGDLLIKIASYHDLQQLPLQNALPE